VSKTGRPRIELTDEHIGQIERMAGYGLTEAAIARILGIHPNTFTQRKKDTERVAVALERGKALAESVIGEALYVKAKGGDVAAIKWWEMTRAGRHEKAETIHRHYREAINEVRQGLRLVG
jgi:IS30 family transposase